MDAIALGVEEAACLILEHLERRLSDAEVDYESFDDLHNFAYSTPFRSLIPRQIDHRFHRIPISDSTAIRSVIPRQIDR